MEEIQLEAITIDEEFEGSKEDAEELIRIFLEETDADIQSRHTTVIDEDGNRTQELNGYDRNTEIWWTSIAILLISNPEGVVQFLKWASDIPGLSMGFTVEGDIRIKIFSDIDFTLIDKSTDYNMEKIGETEDHVVVKIPQEDWRYLYDDIYTERLDVDMPPEDEIGL